MKADDRRAQNSSRLNSPNYPPGARLDPDHDLSARSSNLPPANVSCVLRHYGASLAVYGGALAILLLNPWFRHLLAPSVGSVSGVKFYVGYFAAYAVLSPVVYLICRPATLWHSKNVMILQWLMRLAAHLSRYGFGPGEGSWRPTFKEKHAFMFLVIKLVYGPLMLNGILVELQNYPALMLQWQQSASLIGRLDCAYAWFVSSVFLLDCCLFCFGYHAEARWLRNEVRYVETSLSGLLVCLLCYPPFNSVTGAFLGSSNEDVNILFRGDLHHPLTWVLRGLAMGALLLLTAASLSLFTKASNLTNRGIVDWGPYRWVRHPGYVGKNLFWLITLIPVFFAVDSSNPEFPWGDHLVFCAGRVAGFAGWCAIYVLRALTEERLLLRDPEYQEYCRRVSYRFIPGLI